MQDKILKKFDDRNVNDEELDKAKNTQFGSYAELIKIEKFKYKNPRSE